MFRNSDLDLKSEIDKIGIEATHSAMTVQKSLKVYKKLKLEKAKVQKLKKYIYF